MNQSEARKRAEQYASLGFTAVAQTKGDWPKADDPWFVFIEAPDGKRYEEFDVRHVRARDLYVRQFVRKPDAKCPCGYDPKTRQDLDDHISQGYLGKDGKDHGWG